MIISETFDKFKNPSSTNFNTRLGTPIAIDERLSSDFRCSSTLICFPNNLGMKIWRSESGLSITVTSLTYFKSSVHRIAEMHRIKIEGPDRIFFFEVKDVFQSGTISLILSKSVSTPVFKGASK